MSASAPHVPAHLRAFVVEQDYERYTAIDHAVWRFVLLQLRSRLAAKAHPAYAEGLTASGISVERIPSIAQMNDCLGRFGWSAVSVDGFIPPRAFQEFQASGILPIAAGVRTRDHLVYTPAPDILHEAAGHAPILPDPVFSAYVRRIGELGRHAFTLPDENDVFQAIHDLSEVKERLDAAPADVARAEQELARALACASEASEATRLSRLYWWTAEYGLVGRVDDYKIYGAGLLSSLGESESCHDPSVAKVLLDDGCMGVAYDITRPQPRLYVAPSFEALHDVLDRAERTLAFRLGGATAIDRAIRSRETASVRFSSGAWVTGILAAAAPGDAPAWLDFSGRVGLAWDAAPPGGDVAETGGASTAHQRIAASTPAGTADRVEPSTFLVLTGPLDDGSSLQQASDAAIARWTDPGPGRARLRYSSGAVVEGHVARVVRRPDGRVGLVDWRDAELVVPGMPPRRSATFRLLAAGDFVTARAGAVDPSYHAETAFPGARVPAPAVLDGESARMMALYARAERAHRVGVAAITAEFPAIHAALQRDHPREWLLRWNMLESLIKVGADAGPLVRQLRAELEHLEVDYAGRQPIASGLRYLAQARAA